MGDVEGALDLPVGGVARRDPGNRRGKGKQRNRQRQRGGHHPLQQSQRIALLGLHGRLASAADHTSNFGGGQSEEEMEPSRRPRGGARTRGGRLPQRQDREDTEYGSRRSPG